MTLRINELAAADLRASLLDNAAPDGVACGVLHGWLRLHRLGRLSFNSEALRILGPFLARALELESARDMSRRVDC